MPAKTLTLILSLWQRERQALELDRLQGVECLSACNWDPTRCSPPPRPACGDVFSAKGAALISSLGNTPGYMRAKFISAESAIQFRTSSMQCPI